MLFDLPSSEGGNNRIEMLRSDYFKALLAATLLFLVITLYAIEIQYFNNTLQVKKMILPSLAIGGLGGLALSFRLQSFAEKSLEKFQIFMVVTLLSVAVMPLMVSLSNRLLSFGETSYAEAEFVQSTPFVSSRFGYLPGQEVDGYHTFLIIENQLERMTSQGHPYPNTEEGSKVLAPVKKGLWGFTYFVVDELEERQGEREYQSVKDWKDKFMSMYRLIYPHRCSIPQNLV
ncbi:MAG: hypothetical protein AAF985_23100 [Bacteroidota bacterium]